MVAQFSVQKSCAQYIQLQKVEFFFDLKTSKSILKRRHLRVLNAAFFRHLITGIGCLSISFQSAELKVVIILIGST